MSASNCTAVYRKVFPRDRNARRTELVPLHHDSTPWIGAPAAAEFAVMENRMRFLVRPFDGYSTGLFLEHRDNRSRIREMSVGKRVLNLSAYTCGFSVAAALGGGATTSVDVAVKFLEWGKRNFDENGVLLDGHTFICS